MSDGYIYVLVNPSMEGLLKIGRTSRSARNRVSELSAATGVPTPFLLAYETEFNDCHAAERFVHTFLETKGFRVASNREFFNAPLDVVIEAVLRAKSQDPVSAFAQDAEADELGGSEAWEEVLEVAEAHYYGLGNEIQDYRAARRLFQQAAALGAVAAYRYLANMALLGEGAAASVTEAIEYLKEGAKRGGTSCYAGMAKIFFDEGHVENAEKCWDRYFAQEIPISLDSADDLMNYLDYCSARRIPVKHVEAMKNYRYELVDVLSGRLQGDVASSFPDYARELSQKLDWVKRHL